MKAIVAVLALACATSVQPAALLEMGGARIIVMTAEELQQALGQQQAEIERLKADRKKECGLI